MQSEQRALEYPSPDPSRLSSYLFSNELGTKQCDQMKIMMNARFREIVASRGSAEHDNTIVFYASTIEWVEQDLLA